MADLVELLNGPDARASLARRDVTAVYRLLSDAGVSQARISQATGQSQSDVSAVINGRRVQSIALLERIADGLGVPRGWMGLAYAPGRKPEPPVAEDLMSEQDRRTNLLRHAATVLFGTPVFGPARPITIRDVPTPLSRRIGLSDVAWVTSVGTQLGQLESNLGGLPMSDALTAQAKLCELLLGADMREEVRRQLLAALADLHSMAGWGAADAGLRERAREHHMRGMSCAAAAADKLRLSAILLGEGMTELQFGTPDAALKLFQLGAATAPTPSSRAMFENYASWSLARLGLAEEARAALSRGQHAVDSARERSPGSGDFRCGLPYVAACTHDLLGTFEAAISELTVAIRVDHDALRCSVFKLSALACVQLRAGELKAGVQTATAVIDKARALRSLSVRDRLAPLQQAAAARRDSTCQDLARELATLRAAA